MVGLQRRPIAQLGFVESPHTPITGTCSLFRRQVARWLLSGFQIEDDAADVFRLCDWVTWRAHVTWRDVWCCKARSAYTQWRNGKCILCRKLNVDTQASLQVLINFDIILELYFETLHGLWSMYRELLARKNITLYVYHVWCCVIGISWLKSAAGLENIKWI